MQIAAAGRLRRTTFTMGGARFYHFSRPRAIDSDSNRRANASNRGNNGRWSRRIAGKHLIPFTTPAHELTYRTIAVGGGFRHASGSSGGTHPPARALRDPVYRPLRR